MRLLPHRFARDASRAALATATLLAGFAAQATSGGSLLVTVTPIDSQATYSQLAQPASGVPARPSFLGYSVSIRNTGRSTVTQIRFAGKTQASDPQERATLNAFVGIGGCVTSAGGVAVDCPIGKLKAGESFPTFQVLFNTPVQDTVSQTPAGVVRFSGQVFVAGNKVESERRGARQARPGHPLSPPSNFSQPWSAADIALGTPTRSQVRSLVLANGGRLFTGDTGAPVLNATVDNPFTTAIVVPSIGDIRPAELQVQDETFPGAGPTVASLTAAAEVPTNCSLSLTRCFLAEVTVPGRFSPFLTITLRQDGKTIRTYGGTPVPIDGIAIKYTGGTYSGIPIPLCRGFATSTAIPNGPELHGATPAGLPCIAARKVYGEHDPAVDLRGDYEWTIYNVANGSYRVR